MRRAISRADKSGQAVDVDYLLRGVENELAQLLWLCVDRRPMGIPRGVLNLNPCD